jgi:hypothetical protein
VVADRQFECMGTTCRVVLTGPGASEAANAAEALVRSWAAALTRFDAASKLAWTGLVSVSAVGRSALEAEALAKAAYLGGPSGARAVLAAGGGLLVHEDGEVEVIAMSSGAADGLNA